MTAQQRQAALDKHVERLNAWLAEQGVCAHASLLDRGKIGPHFHYALRLEASAGHFAGQGHEVELGRFHQAVATLDAILNVWVTARAIRDTT